jgi:hypothetical protein
MTRNADFSRQQAAQFERDEVSRNLSVAGSLCRLKPAFLAGLSLPGAPVKNAD